MTDKPKPKIVEIVKSDYQPTKAELEEEFELDVPGETLDQRMRSLTLGLLRPVNLRRITWPRKRR